MDDVNRFARELADAIAAAAADHPKVEACRERARAAGYEMRVTLEAIVGFVNRNSGPIIITGNVGDATAQAATQTMSRFLNRLPSITIREGHRVKVYLTSDLQLPVYQPSKPDRGLRIAGRVQP